MATKPATNTPRPRPTGEEVVPAILDAAAELFAERGPANTSLREVAARADVTYGLVFRHFGVKKQLVGAVLNHLGQQLVEVINTGTAAQDLEPVVDRHTQVVARAILDGYPADTLQTRFPANEILISELTAKFDDELVARLTAANSNALQLGWRIFESYLRASNGLQTISAEDLREAINASLNKIITL